MICPTRCKPDADCGRGRLVPVFAARAAVPHPSASLRLRRFTFHVSRFTLPCSLAATIAPRRRRKSARRKFSPLGKQAMSGYSLYCSSQHSFITGIAAIHTVQCHSDKGAMGKLAGHQNTCERDNSRNRAHTVVQGRFCNPAVAQVGLGMATCARRKS